jgi:hypothetical protein
MHTGETSRLIENISTSCVLVPFELSLPEAGLREILWVNRKPVMKLGTKIVGFKI